MVTTNYLLTDQLQEHGYVLVKGILDDELDLEPVRKEYKNALNKLARKWQSQKKIKNTYEELPLGKQLIEILSEYPEAPYYENLDISLPKTGQVNVVGSEKHVIQDETLMHTGPAIFNLLTNPQLLDFVEQFIGPEIYSNPVQHVRTKPPVKAISKKMKDHLRGTGLVTGTQWHQDQGVVIAEADETEILTVWLPLTKATKENGCLVVAKKSHKQGLVLHCTRTEKRPQWKGIEIPQGYIREETIPIEMEPGDVLFLNKLTKHCSLENNSDDIRWSFDLRYQPIGQPTGRPYFPGFVARSQNNPKNELKDHKVWRQLWIDAKRKLIAHNESEYFNRWDPEDQRCA